MSYNPNPYVLLGSALAVDCNATGDVIIPINGAKKYFPLLCFATNKSGTWSSADIQLWTGAPQSGTEATGVFTLNTLSATTDMSTPVLGGGPQLFNTSIQTAQELYLYRAVANGSPFTVDIFLYGVILE